MGLSDILAGRDDLGVLLSRSLLDSKYEHLTLLTAGRASSNPAVLLSKPRLGELIDLLKGQFDAIVMDSVPVSAYSAFLAEHSDGVVIVVHAQRTTHRSLRYTLQTLRQGTNRIVANIYGIVFNRISLQLTTTYNQPYYRRNLAIDPEKLNREMLQYRQTSCFIGTQLECHDRFRRAFVCIQSQPHRYNWVLARKPCKNG